MRTSPDVNSSHVISPNSIDHKSLPIKKHVMAAIVKSHGDADTQLITAALFWDYAHFISQVSCCGTVLHVVNVQINEFSLVTGSC